MPTCQIIGLISMFHRLIGLSSVLLVCLAGCSLCSHQDSGCCQQDSGCCQHGHQHGNCRKHSRQPPMQRMATAFRRASSKRMSGPHASGCACGSCGSELYSSQPMMWEQSVCGQPMCGIEQASGCDSCAPSMNGGCSAVGSPVNGEFYAMAEQASTGCSCGQQHSTNGSMYIPEGNGPYEYSVEAAVMSVPANNQTNMIPRSFPPQHPNKVPAAPDSLNDNVAQPLPIPPADEGQAPIPQDLTPIDAPMEFPKSTPGEFDPLKQEGAPAAENVLDPVSFEIPRLPPIPESSRSSAKRGESQQVQPIATDSEQFQR